MAFVIMRVDSGLMLGSCVCLLSWCGSMVLRLCFDSLNTFLSLIAVSVSPRDPKNRLVNPRLLSLERRRDGGEARQGKAVSALHRAVSISASSGKTISSQGRMWGKRDAETDTHTHTGGGVDDGGVCVGCGGEAGDSYQSSTAYKHGCGDEVKRLSL